MIYTRPFITKKFIAFAGDSRRTDLSLAVLVNDAFTRRLQFDGIAFQEVLQQPLVRLDVSLKELPDFRPIRGERGFYCFEGTETVTIDGNVVVRVPIPNGNYTLILEPDPTSGNWYNLQPKAGDPWTDAFERPVTLPMPNPLLPLETVTLSPTPAYPFPANATLVRGLVIQNGAPLPLAVVDATYNEVDPNDTSLTVPVHVETISDRVGEFVLFFRNLPQKTQPVLVTATKGADQNQAATVITEGTTLNNQVLDLT
jgi:hypothetical protein